MGVIKVSYTAPGGDAAVDLINIKDNNTVSSTNLFQGYKGWNNQGNPVSGELIGVRSIRGESQSASAAATDDVVFKRSWINAALDQNMIGATIASAGERGLVPAPAQLTSESDYRYLTNRGTFVIPQLSHIENAKSTIEGWATTKVTETLAADDTPLIDGAANAGISTSYSRADHIHPTDISRAAVSHMHGDITNNGDITTTAAIAEGDRLIINDESASKITNSSIVFGSSTTQFLANDGTWQTPDTYDLPIANATTPGGIIVGNSLTIDSTGVLNYILPASVAPTTSNPAGVLGGVIVDGTTIIMNTTDSKISAVIPIATSNSRGTIQPSADFNIDGSGVLTINPIDANDINALT